MKEFEDMQVIWNRQNDEKLYAINEDALHAKIQRRSQSINRLLEIFEWIMIGVNLVVAIVLVVDAIQDKAAYEYITATAYFGYAAYAVYRRLARRREEVRFEETMLGELDRALWRINYLIDQSRTIILWYLAPLMLVVSLTMILNGRPLWTLGLPIVILPLTYYGSRWETNRFYLPKKRALETLRETLVAS